MTYLDYAATAPVRPEITRRLVELCEQPLGNPSSLHRAGRRARMVIEHARQRCAELLGAKVEEIVFCSGATEADNLALLGYTSHADCQHHRLIVSTIEHAAVFETAKRQEQLGRQVEWVGVDDQGRVRLEELEERLTDGPPALVSVMGVNNEVGVRQPVLEIGRMCREHGALYHTDAVQDPTVLIDLIAENLVDLACLSGHKLGGLPGGILYVRQGIPLNPMVVGGSQEDGRRAGTSEVLRAESLALSLACPRPDVVECRNILEEVLGEIPGAVLLGKQAKRADHISSWLFAGLSAEPVLVALDMKGICASSGSACSSHSVEPSRVVKEMGYPDDQASGLVRFSFGWKSGKTKTREAAETIKSVVLHLMNKEKRCR